MDHVDGQLVFNRKFCVRSSIVLNLRSDVFSGPLSCLCRPSILMLVLLCGVFRDVSFVLMSSSVWNSVFVLL